MISAILYPKAIHFSLSTTYPSLTARRRLVFYIVLVIKYVSISISLGIYSISKY